MILTFNSYVFLLAFLPIVIGGYYLLTRVLPDQRPALVWLVLASLVFYGLQGPGYLIVLVGSVVLNFLVAWWMTTRPPGSRARRTALTVGVVGNLLLLGAYKYTGFLADNINALFGTHLSALTTAYPIGLSFYTFIQLGFLIDAYVGQTKRPNFLRYALFGTFFPYVTAGPIVRPGEIMEQLDEPVRQRTGSTRLAVGATMFAMGLFKKAVLADSVAPYATTLFAYSSGHDTIGVGNAWVGMLAYTLQLYFDFSGYTDMALGIGHMLGIRLPLNFNSPLKATSIIDFWRRWHMTMTRWFTDFIYTPLAANLMRRSMRKGHSTAIRVLLVLCLPVIVTFLLVGLWHGAGWGFVIWGAIQGGAMAINLLWREAGQRMPGVLGWLLMMITFVSSLTFFRAPDTGTAFTILRAMFGLGPAGAPTGQFYGTSRLFQTITVTPALLWVIALLAIALFFPRNTQQILGRYDVGLPTMAAAPDKPSRIALTWRPNLRWALITGGALAAALVFAGGPSPFLYYQF
ncbi:MBOAT family O-acyltransferase [Amycolatopsis plumensis]|uniref:MBOAT family O-acyltransferase n=1 Tax=Amycolatopsis plumensis TaxID=236508 RepID=A0ABV5UFV7_9PSEU